MKRRNRGRGDQNNYWTVFNLYKKETFLYHEEMDPQSLMIVSIIPLHIQVLEPNSIPNVCAMIYLRIENLRRSNVK